MSDGCCEPREDKVCCAPEKDRGSATGKVRSCCAGSGDTACVPRAVLQVTSRLTASDRIDHLLARWGINRAGHRVGPGLYSLGEPDEDSPVYVTANYTLSFDALRSALDGADCYILVLDTRGSTSGARPGRGHSGPTSWSRGSSRRDSRRSSRTWSTSTVRASRANSCSSSWFSG